MVERRVSSQIAKIVLDRYFNSLRFKTPLIWNMIWLGNISSKAITFCLKAFELKFIWKSCELAKKQDTYSLVVLGIPS
jgi:hypothetical protein